MEYDIQKDIEAQRTIITTEMDMIKKDLESTDMYTKMYEDYDEARLYAAKLHAFATELIKAYADLRKYIRPSQSFPVPEGVKLYRE